MSGFFAWCASIRKPPKDGSDAVEEKGDEFEDGVSVT